MIDLEPELLDAQGAVFTQDWDRLDDVCRYVLERDPKNRWAMATLIQALLQNDQPKEAQDIGAEMVRIYPDNELSYVRFAESYDGAGDHARANEIIRQGLKAIPDSQRLRYFDLVTAFDAKQEGVCTSLVPAAVADYPDVASMRLMVARCALAAGETRDALEALGEAVRRGFRDFDSLLETDDFATLAEDPRFLYLRRVVEEGSEQGGSS